FCWAGGLRRRASQAAAYWPTEGLGTPARCRTPGIAHSAAARANLRRCMLVARPLSVAFAVTGVVALLSFLLPPEWQSTGVGLCLVGATYVLVLRGDAELIRRYGLGLGGMFEPVPLELRRLCWA